MKSKFRIFWHDSIDSTNDEALRQIDALDNLSVIAAREQTAGRGQRGNRWSSAPGENLTFSIVLRFGPEGLAPLPTREQFRLSCMTTLALRDFLADAGASVRIKWPNDIYAGDRKLCGMLIENGLAGDSLAYSVIGIGLNLNQRSFPVELVNPTSLARLTGQHYPLEASLLSFLDCFERRLAQLMEGECLYDEYRQYLYRIGERHEYVDCASGASFVGSISDVLPDGRLVLTLPDGSTRSYGFKEISYII